MKLHDAAVGFVLFGSRGFAMVSACSIMRIVITVVPV